MESQNSSTLFPLGKLPVEALAAMLSNAPLTDPRVVLGPGIGLDCAVVDMGGKYLVFKSEPITFATDEIGWYSVQISANDIATTGAAPQWYLASLLLPENRTTPALVEKISSQIYAACREMGVSVLGGHTEVTHGLDRPILVATLVGEVEKERLVTPRGALPGDVILLTKGAPIEATALLAREFPERLSGVLTPTELQEAREFLYQPGISVVKDARIACAAGAVHAMHDPTEGGVASALWEMAQASGKRFVVNPQSVPVPAVSRKVCAAFGLNPLASIASGALLLCTPEPDAAAITRALAREGILCGSIGRVESGAVEVQDEQTGLPLERPVRDDITRVYES